MRRILVFNMVTADGFYAGPNDEIDWHNVDAEFNDFAIAQLDSLDTLIFGRRTYEGMAAWWPTPQGLADDPEVAGRMNRLTKLVLSNTLTSADWEHTTILKGNVGEQLAAIKQQPGKDMAIFGSGKVVASLTPLGLIDEYRLMVNPVILGRGKTLFEGVPSEVKLRLAKTQPFNSGNVLLYYEPRG